MPNPRNRYAADDGADEHALDAAPSLADNLIMLAESEAAFFRSADRRAWARIHDTGKVMSVDPKGLGMWLRARHYDVTGAAIGVTPLNTAIATLAARASHGSDERIIATRVRQDANTLFIDLGGETGDAVAVDRNGWTVVNNAPVIFTRTAQMRSLPAPGGDAWDIRKVVNIINDDDVILLIGWIITAMRGKGPYPILILKGPAGSAKSTAARLIRALIDPGEPATRALPSDDRDMFIAARACHVLSFDNLSSMSARTSDTLCRLATGGGFATRALHTNADEALFDAQRPIILNGIEGFANRSDLLDRAWQIDLGPIPASERRTEREIDAEFEALRPGLLGALLDIVAAGMANLDAIRADFHDMPRMADAYAWVSACESGFAEPGAFIKAYNAAQQLLLPHALEADPLAASVLTFLIERGEPEWSGSASDLLAEINPTKDRRGGLPIAANALSQALSRAEPVLLRAGWSLSRGREATVGRERRIVLRRIVEASS